MRDTLHTPHTRVTHGTQQYSSGIPGNIYRNRKGFTEEGAEILDQTRLLTKMALLQQQRCDTCVSMDVSQPRPPALYQVDSSVR